MGLGWQDRLGQMSWQSSTAVSVGTVSKAREEPSFEEWTYVACPPVSVVLCAVTRAVTCAVRVCCR